MCSKYVCLLSSVKAWLELKKKRTAAMLRPPTSVFLSLIPCLIIGVWAGALVQDDPGEPGVIEGAVLDHAGSPLASVNVRVQERGRPQAGVLHSVITDKAGQFRVERLRLGVYEVFVSARGESVFPPKLTRVVHLTAKHSEQRITIRMGNVPDPKPRAISTLEKSCVLRPIEARYAIHNNVGYDVLPMSAVRALLCC